MTDLIIFFPHKGIHDNYYLKDYYYSKKMKKSQFEENTTHIEWDLGEINEISSKYYQEEKINVIQWNKLKYKYNIQDYLFLKIFFYLL